MAFVKVDTANGDSRFTSKLITALNSLDNTYAHLKGINEEMQEMSATQIEELYGLTGFGAVVKGYVNDAVLALEEEDSALEVLRRQMG